MAGEVGRTAVTHLEMMVHNVSPGSMASASLSLGLVIWKVHCPSYLPAGAGGGVMWDMSFAETEVEG